MPFASDLAQWTLELLHSGASGLFHAVNDEGISRFDWTKSILAEAAKAGLISAEPPVEPVGRIALKGVSRELSLWRVVAPDSASLPESVAMGDAPLRVPEG